MFFFDVDIEYDCFDFVVFFVFVNGFFVGFVL